MNLENRIKKLESRIRTEKHIVVYPTFQDDGNVWMKRNDEEPMLLSLSEAEEMKAAHTGEVLDIKVNFIGDE